MAGGGLSLAQVLTCYRRALVAAAVAGGLILVGLSIVGHWDAGLVIVVGLLLGAWNGWLVQKSMMKYVDEQENRQKFMRATLRRLGYITAVCAAIAIGFRPVGWTVIIGIGLFQVFMIAAQSRALFRELRAG